MFCCACIIVNSRWVVFDRFLFLFFLLPLPEDKCSGRKEYINDNKMSTLKEICYNNVCFNEEKIK